MEEKEYGSQYAIPANYTDSGKLLGGMLEPRNAAETVALLVLLGYPELKLPMPGDIRIVAMTVTLLPLAVLSMMGIDGDSLFQYMGHMLRYFVGRRKLHFRRVGYCYDPKQLRSRKGEGHKGRGGGRAGWFPGKGKSKKIGKAGRAEGGQAAESEKT